MHNTIDSSVVATQCGHEGGGLRGQVEDRESSVTRGAGQQALVVISKSDGSHCREGEGASYK